MPAHPWQSSFTAGELTDELAARTDWAKYEMGARCLTNFVVRPQGGVARRAGTVFVAATKDPSRLAILRRFEFSVEQTYMLEFGHRYLRVFAERAPVLVAGQPLELVTPYEEDDLRSLRFEQSADVLYIAHRRHAPRKLQRLGPTEWRLDVITFRPAPSWEEPILPLADLTLTAASGTGVTATASSVAFLAGDQGRQITSGAGRAVITSVVSGTQVTLDILTPFATTGPIPAGDWAMDGSPNFGTLTPSADKPVNALATFTASLDAFRATDVGRYLIGNEGVAQIVTVTSPVQVTAQILREFKNTTAIPAGGWTLEAPAWSDALGWPGVVLLADQRLWWAGSDKFPDTLWGSVVADYENHAPGPADDDAVKFTLASPGVNLIRWMKGLQDGFAVGTLAQELTVEGAGSEPISASSVLARDRTRWGSDHDVDAIRADRVIFFVQRGGQRVREFAFAFEADTYLAPDLTIVAPHLTRSGVRALAYAKSPESILFAVTSDGQLLSLTYERPEQVMAWSHHDTQGLFEWVEVKPNHCGTGDEVWVIVRRTLEHGPWLAPGYLAPGYLAQGGLEARRYIEVFDGSLQVDAGLLYEGPPASTFTGLSHLEGLTVKAVDQDGRVDDLVVSGGQITLPDSREATRLEVGLHYTSTLQTLRPHVPTAQGSSRGRIQHWNRVVVFVYCTRGQLRLNGEALRYPVGWPSSQPYTGELEPKLHLRWDHEQILTVQTVEPKPCAILGLTGSFQTDDG
ncbi:MAG TPA: hypothetical protein VNK50_13110 [Calidithermus sp.]|nr:hypothetical protein [Calidithermus sp.]